MKRKERETWIKENEKVLDVIKEELSKEASETLSEVDITDLIDEKLDNLLEKDITDINVIKEKLAQAVVELQKDTKEFIEVEDFSELDNKSDILKYSKEVDDEETNTASKGVVEEIEDPDEEDLEAVSEEDELVTDEELEDMAEEYVDYDPVHQYLKEIGNIPLLTPDEEIKLFKALKTASEEEKEEIRKKIIASNLRLVVSIAKRYVGHGMLFLDLVEEGNIGLIKGIDKFDVKKGYKLSTYATWWIKQAVTRSIADYGRTIRIPVHAVENINKVVRTTRVLEMDLGRQPKPAEIAEKMGVPEETVKYFLKISQEPVSLSTPIGEEEDSSLQDFIVDEKVSTEKTAYHVACREALEKVLSTLTDREQKILRLRFGFDDGRARTLNEVGKEFHVTRERIRQIEAKALRKLRHPSRANKVKGFLDN